MRYLFYTLLLLAVTGAVSATEYHVAPAPLGNDSSGNGSAAQPWATPQHALGRAGSGDTILLARDGVYRVDSLTVPQGVTLRAGAGAGESPVLTGAVAVDSWTPWANNSQVLTATVDASAVTQCAINGSLLTPARYPNNGWLRTDAGTDNNLIVDSAVAGSGGQWTGAQVRWRKWTWWYETRPITSDNGNGRLSLGGKSFIDGLTGIGSGYFIDGSLAALDAPGEWYFDAGAKRLYVIPPSGSGSNPSVEATVRESAVQLDGGTLEGIIVRHYTGPAIAINHGSSRLINSRIEQVLGHGVSGTWNAGGAQVTGNTLHDVAGIGINWIENTGGASGTRLADNVLTEIGTRNGYGGSTAWDASGIAIIAGNEVTISGNRFDRIGYAGVVIGTDGQIIERNVLRRCLATKVDGGAIYVNASACIIRDNIVIGSIGDLESTHPWTPLGQGIWPEFLSEFRDHEIVGNTVLLCNGNGLFLPNNYSCTVEDNVLVSNRLGGLWLEGDDGENGKSVDPNAAHRVANNVMGVGAIPWQSTGAEENLADWAGTDDFALGWKLHSNVDMDYGTMSGTTLLQATDGDLLRRSDGIEPSVNEWQSWESDWADPAPLVVTQPVYVFINDSSSQRDIDLPGGITWQRLDGSAVGSSVSVAAFRSAPLIAAGGDTSGLPLYQLVSEGDLSVRSVSLTSSRGGEWTIKAADAGAPRPNGTPITNGSRFDSLNSGAAYRFEPVSVSASTAPLGDG